MDTLLSTIRAAYPQFTFHKADMASWSPKRQQVSYVDSSDPTSKWSLLHELGHGVLGHADFTSDLDLLDKELQAWDKARDIAEQYGVTISEDHIQQCIDSYRDWIHKRSTCPRCLGHGIQQTSKLYSCPNCQTPWNVTTGRLSRPYRLRVK